MNKIELNRNNNIYLEIESFKDYELTQCIAYEMAIRSRKNIEQIHRLKEYYEKNKVEIFTLVKSNSILTKEDYSIEFFKIGELINDIDVLSFNYHDRRLGVDYILKEVASHKKKLEINYDNELFEDNIEIIEREGYKLKIELNKIMSFDKKEHAYLGNLSIINNFQRPKIKSNLVSSKNIMVGIDLTRPLNEIIAHITHIKKDLEENSDIVKAPIDLLGNKIQDDFKYKFDDSGTSKILSVQHKMADMFYIYDSLNCGMTQRKIQNKIFNYYADMGIETKTMDQKTLKKYKEIAIEYIDNMRYKELVTGTKIN